MNKESEITVLKAKVEKISFLQETDPLKLEALELDEWLRGAVAPIAGQGTLKERVINIMMHYATQGGRWLKNEQRAKAKRKFRGRRAGSRIEVQCL